MKQWFKGELNEQWNWGGANPQIVKAVLDNIGRRYLVEHTEADDGSWWADRYSDGFVIQCGIKAKSGSRTTITLPVMMANTNYFAFVTNSDLAGNDDSGWSGSNGGNLGTRTTSSFIYSAYGDCSWYVSGYAA